MAQFQFRAADAEGKVVEGMIEAAESAAVIARLQDRGLIPIRVGRAELKLRQRKPPDPGSGDRRWIPMRVADVSGGKA